MENVINLMIRFLGLYLYDRAGDVARKERQVRVAQAKTEEPLLPISGSIPSTSNGHAEPSYIPNGFVKSNGFTESTSLDSRSVPIAV